MTSQFTKSLFDCANGNSQNSLGENGFPIPETHVSIKTFTENQSSILFEAFGENLSDIEGDRFQKQEFSGFASNEFFQSSHEIDHKS